MTRLRPIGCGYGCNIRIFVGAKHAGKVFAVEPVPLPNALPFRVKLWMLINPHSLALSVKIEEYCRNLSL
jgi:hypothetical protein